MEIHTTIFIPALEYCIFGAIGGIGRSIKNLKYTSHSKTKKIIKNFIYNIFLGAIAGSALVLVIHPADTYMQFGMAIVGGYNAEAAIDWLSKNILSKSP